MKKIFLPLFILIAIFSAGCLDDIEDVDKPVATNEIFPKFSTVDLNNNPVTNEIFAQKKVTVVNVWGTFCGPCIAEMPELGKWAKNISPDAQIIGIVCDISNSNDSAVISDAKDILQDANANFINIIPDESLQNFLQEVEAVPTTFLVDSKGNIVGEPVVGADVEQYMKNVKRFLNE